MDLKKLKALRREKNITQKELADVLGVTATNVSRYEKGIITPPSDKLKKIADYFGVTVDVLLDIEGAEPDHFAYPYKVQRVCDLDADKYVLQVIPELEQQCLDNAGGICELCGNKAPFHTKDGHPYLETHYILWLSKGGKPAIDNMVALCPNCHMKIHILQDGNDLSYLTEVADRHRTSSDKS